MLPRAVPIAPRVSAAADPVAGVPAGAPPRLTSLDVFRGLTIAAMLLVNNPGTWDHVYWPLEHAEWNGWTPTDLVFPFFLFIVGMAVTFSLAYWTERGATAPELLAKVAVRAAIIFGLGLLLQGFPHYDLVHIRVFGVLQRIALSYLLAGAIVLSTGARGQVVALLGLLAGYWSIMTLVPVPGIGHAALEPGQTPANGVSRGLFGLNPVWQGTGTWARGGILSTAGAVATVLCGALAGRWIRSARPPAAKVTGLVLAGAAAIIVGLIWGRAFPINKSVWTGSYVALSGGIACLVLASTYWLVDVKGYRRWTGPLLVFGTNSIVAFWLSSCVAIVLDWIVISDAAGEPAVMKKYLYETLYASWLDPANASLAYAVTYVMIWLALLSLLYRRRIFIRI